MPEIIPPKIIPPQPERHNRVADRKNKPSLNTKDTRAPVAPTSGTSETSKRPEPVIDEPETYKSPKFIKSSNEVSSAIVLNKA
ncbi:hypothetical protein GLOIN_2v1814667 [Rhizophagus irregularis DAOM 181602=DAOM 197198]|nr:hypothetical protein GLOIN_2v1814667 [Rhizophagus irregularis DAOM 181602=DAOM 197198]